MHGKLGINKILFIATVILMSIVYWNYLIGHMGADSYAVSVNYESYAKSVYIVDGRVFTFLFVMLASKLNIKMLTLMSISAFLAIIVSTIAILNIKNEVCKRTQLNKVQEVFVWLISSTVIFNFMMTELMYFPESFIMALSLLFYVLAARFFMEKKDVKAFLLTLIGVFCYQGTIGFFFVIAATFSLIKNKKLNKKFFIELFLAVIITALAAITNLVFIKIIAKAFNITQNKQFSISVQSLISNIGLIGRSICPILKDNCGLLPSGVLLKLMIIMIIFTLIISIKEKKNSVLGLIFLMIIAISSSFALFVIQTGSMYTGRVHFCIGALIRSIYAVYIFYIRPKK